MKHSLRPKRLVGQSPVHAVAHSSVRLTYLSVILAAVRLLRGVRRLQWWIFFTWWILLVAFLDLATFVPGGAVGGFTLWRYKFPKVRRPARLFRHISLSSTRADILWRVTTGGPSGTKARMI